MDVHPTKNGINRYWSIPIWSIHFEMVCNEFSVIQVEIGHCAKPTGYIEKLSTAGVGADWESNSEYLHRSSIFVGFALAFKGWVPDLRVKMIWEWRPNTTEYNVQQLWIVSFRKSSGKSTMSYTSLQACVKLFHCSVPGCMSLSLRVFFASHLFGVNSWTSSRYHPVGGCSRFVQRYKDNCHEGSCTVWTIRIDRGALRWSQCGSLAAPR